MDAVRLNFSHGDHATHKAMIMRLRKACADKGHLIPIIQDLQGPRFRVGKLRGGYLDLKRGMEVTVGSNSRDCMIPIFPRYSFRSVRRGHRILVGDLGVSLKVLRVSKTCLVCKVIRGGTIHSGKGVQFPHSKADLPALTEKDRRDVKFGIAHGVDFIALSFVRQPSDIVKLRKLIRGHDIGIIAKIETREAVGAIDEIIDEADAILVARGDLASEVSISRLPLVQKIIIEKCNHKGKPVITATQMLESMITNPQPTRAEASDVANAVLDGSDAVMLSGETAVGSYPIEAIRTMAALINCTEKAHLDEWIRRRRRIEPEAKVDETIAFLAAGAAERLGAAAIITSTRSGSTALRVAKFRPDVPVLAVTPNDRTLMKLALSYGVISEQIAEAENTDEMIRLAIDAARRRGIAGKGDLVVITAGVPPWVTGTTNLLKLEVV